MSERLDIRPYKAMPGLSIWAHWGKSRRLNVCFSGVGAKDTPVQQPEFARTTTRNGRDSALFISDTDRSWLAAPGLIERIAAEIEGFAAAIGAKLVNTIGYSMGGFMALALSGFTRVEAALAFSPQVSVHPEVVGDDPRWMIHRKRIETHRIRSVMDHLNNKTRYYVFHGLRGYERLQRDRFAARPNLIHFVIPRTVHRVPQKLRAAGLLEDVALACFDGRHHHLRKLLAPMNPRLRDPAEMPDLPPSAMLAGAGS